MTRVLAGFAAGVILIALLVGLGSGVFDRARADQELRHREDIHQVTMAVREERARLQIERERDLQPVFVAATGLVLLAVGFTALGVGFYLVASLNKRSRLVHADAHGLFPVIRMRIGKAEAIYDPNRSPVASTIYTIDRADRVIVLPVVISGLEDASQAAVRQAQAVQLTRAAVSGSEISEAYQVVTKRLFLPEERQPPRVRVLHSPSPEIEQLLEDRGDGD